MTPQATSLRPKDEKPAKADVSGPVSEVCIVGDRKSILPFKAFGISTFEAKNSVDAQEILDSIKQKRIVFITEELIEGEPPSNVTVIPGRKGSLGYGKSILKNVIKKATGTEVPNLNNSSQNFDEESGEKSE
jgi:vacuolar-type H+-ATPase subunit F/Vma7